MSSDNNLYGKLKNGVLIVAPALIVRNGQIEYDNEELYQSAGYKKVVYSPAPENEVGYNLISSWLETDASIVQKWEKVKLPFDQSDRLLCAIRDFNHSMKYIQKSIIKQDKENHKELEQRINENLLFRIIYAHKDLLPEGETLLTYLHKCNMNLQEFFAGLSAIEELKKHHIVIFPTHLAFEQFIDDESKFILFPYVKSNLSYFNLLSSFSTVESKTKYDMSYMFGFTLFDELLLLFIKYILRLESNWLIGNTTVTFHDIAECTDIEAVKGVIIDKKVEELSWQSYLDKIYFLRDRGIKTIAENEALFTVDLLYIAEKRNIIVHNSGIWNASSMGKLKGTKYYNSECIGKPVEKTVSSIIDEMQLLLKAAKMVYDALCEKFNLLHRYELVEDIPDEDTSATHGCMISKL